MTERSGDGDLDVDAAWAQIVAHWDTDDLSVVSDDDPGTAAATGWSGAPAASTPALGPQPAGGAEAGPVGKTPRAEEQDDEQDAPPTAAGSLGWDAIRPHVGGEEVRASARDRTDPDSDSGPLAALDEHFVPPDPPSLRPSDPMTALAWLGALGGPVFLLVAALVWRTAPSLLIGAAVLAFVAGFVTLVVRMPDERHDEDDGAVV